MHKTDPYLIEKCRILKRNGFTLGEIIKAIGVPKTTIYNYTHDIILSPEAEERLMNTRERLTKENTKKINEFNIRERKGKCALGRVFFKPKSWTNELVYLIAHFMFDGQITSHSCIYCNRSEALINRMRLLMKKVFNLEPKNWTDKKTGVHRISYHYVEFAIYARKKAKELIKGIITDSLVYKKIFLQAFFDDEGCAYWHKRARKIRGFQHNLKVLKLVQKLLKDFGIESKIDKKYQEIIISRKENLIKFRNKINFSKGIYINPNRKNSIWKRKLEKREILNKIIDSYQK